MVRIALGNSVFEGANAVYLLGRDADGPTTLVDTGVATPAVEADLRDGLANHGVSVADVDHVLLTHFHEDHAGLAGTVQAAGGARVSVHAADAPLVERSGSAPGDFRERLRTRWAEWGMPASSRERLEAFFDDHSWWSEATASVETVADGDRVRAGDRSLEVLHLPGHTAGLVGFLDTETDRLYAGDALLPEYTPNVGGADVRVAGALSAYVDSLHRIVDLAPARALPGHREPIEDPAGRAREILGHHRERTRRVVEVLRDGPADAWTVGAALFGDLAGIHILHGPGEAAAHLEHLAAAGAVEREGRRYALRVEGPDPAALIPAPP